MQKQAENKYRELSDGEKNIKREYGRSRYQNMSEENKQRHKRYQKKSLQSKKIDIKHFYFFSLYSTKMGKSLDFW